MFFMEKKGDDQMTVDTLTAKEVAQLFDKSVSTIYSWENKGLISPVYISPSGRGKLYNRKAMEELHQKGFRRE